MSTWNEEFVAWASRHAAVFGLFADGDSAMFAAWHDEFRMAGFDVADLHAATNHMAQVEAPKFRSDHLVIIQRIVGDRRREAALKQQKAVEFDSGKSVCVLCGDTGAVAVPHPRFVLCGEWQFHGNAQITAAVLCFCWRGRRIGEAQKAWHPDLVRARGGQQMTLEQYEQRIPRETWESLMRDQRERQKAARRARQVTKEIDKQCGAIAAKTRVAITRVVQKATAAPPEEVHAIGDSVPF